jgi:P pilus assembly chaperone PapD
MVAFIALTLSRAFSFTMEPMSAVVSTSGDGRVATFRVTNDGDERIAVRFRVVSRSLSSSGAEQNAEVPADFTVYPARTVVEKGQTASVKIQWRGPSTLDRERCYRFIAEEVPIDSGKDSSSGLRVLFRYIASVYAGSPAFAPSLVARVQPAVDAQENGVFAIEIANTGTRHVIAGNLEIDLTYPDGFVYTIRSDEISPLNGANYLPGSTIRASARRGQSFRDGSFEVSVRYESEY